MASQSQPNRVRAALAHPINLIALAGAAAASGAMLDVRPILGALAAEAVYLAIVGLAPQESTLAQSVSETPVKPAAPAPKTAKPAPSKALPAMKPELQEQYKALEYHFESIKGQIDADTPVHDDILATLSYLIEKFVYFGLREQEFKQRLFLLAEEGEKLKSETQPHRPMLKMVGGESEELKAQLQDDSVAGLVARAHSGYEARVAAVHQSIEMHPPASEESLEHLQMLKRRLKHVDTTGKILATVRHQMNSIGVKLETVDEEILTCSPVQELKDLKALVVETDSIIRTLDTMEPLEGIKKSAAA